MRVVVCVSAMPWCGGLRVCHAMGVVVCVSVIIWKVWSVCLPCHMRGGLCICHAIGVVVFVSNMSYVWWSVCLPCHGCTDLGSLYVARSLKLNRSLASTSGGAGARGFFRFPMAACASVQQHTCRHVPGIEVVMSTNLVLIVNVLSQLLRSRTVSS